MKKGDLLIIGGNEDKTGNMEVLRKFVELCSARKGKIGILPTASSVADEVAKEYKSLFGKLGKQQTIIFNINSRADAMREEWCEQLAGLSGLFISGGDQVKLTSILGGTPFYKKLQQLWHEGLPIGGTSAGAAVMSRHMIMASRTDEETEQTSVAIGSGFGFLEDAIIDQHFTQRARFNRLMLAIANNPQIMGIGIDENTAIWVKDEAASFEVFGEHAVTVFDGEQLTFVDVADKPDNAEVTISGVRLHVMTKGYRFDLINRKLTPPEKEPVPHENQQN